MREEVGLAVLLLVGVGVPVLLKLAVLQRGKGEGREEGKRRGKEGREGEKE